MANQTDEEYRTAWIEASYIVAGWWKEPKAAGINKLTNEQREAIASELKKDFQEAR